MQKIDVFDIFASGFAYTWKYHLFNGLLLLILGVAILFMPQLLVAMAAAFFIVLGISFIGFAWSLRKFNKKYSGFRNEISSLF